MTCKPAVSEENVDFWQPGIDCEYECIFRSEALKLIRRHPKIHVLPRKYVFKIKNGKSKVHLVALGYSQINVVHYNATFAPVVTFSTIRTMLAVVSHYNMELEQVDIVTAFLN